MAKAANAQSACLLAVKNKGCMVGYVFKPMTRGSCRPVTFDEPISQSCPQNYIYIYSYSYIVIYIVIYI